MAATAPRRSRRGFTRLPARESVWTVAKAVRKRDVVQIPEPRLLPVQPGFLVVNAQFFNSLYFEAAFKTKIFRKALSHAEDNLFA